MLPSGRSKADFIDRVEESFGKDPLSDPDKAIAAVFDLLSAKVSAGEIEDVRQSLPADIRVLWRNE